MSLIAILASLLIEHFYDQVGHWRRYDWFHAYVDWLRSRLQQDWVMGFIELLVILVPLALAVVLIESWSGGLVALVFSILVLVVCLGPQDLRSQMCEYQQALEVGDEAGARHQAQQWLAELPEAANEQHSQVLRAAFVAANVRIFGVLCWFLLLGPLGAVLYRAIKELAAHPMEGELALNAALDKVELVIDWLPVRMIVIGFAITGHFDNALRAWRNNIHEAGWAAPAEELLDDVGKGALDVALPDDWAPVFAAAADLIRRTLIVWVFILALLTISGWLA